LASALFEGETVHASTAELTNVPSIWRAFMAISLI